VDYSESHVDQQQDRGLSHLTDEGDPVAFPGMTVVDSDANLTTGMMLTNEKASRRSHTWGR